MKEKMDMEKRGEEEERMDERDRGGKMMCEEMKGEAMKRGMKVGKLELVYWAAALIPFVISLACFDRLPSQVPTQWGWQGQVKGYSSREMACFGIPAFMLAMEIVVAVSFRLDPKWKNIRRNGAMRWISRWFIAGLGILVQLVIVSAGLGYPVDTVRLVSVPIGLMVTAMGNYLPRCRYNFTMGIRTPWTLNDEENWTKTHRIAGYLWVPGGLFMAVLGYLRLAVPFFAVLIVITMIPTAYSYLYYRKGQQEG